MTGHEHLTETGVSEPIVAQTASITHCVDVVLLADACRTADPTNGHQALFDSIARAACGLDFRLTLTRTGWHRPAGIVAGDGRRISDNLRAWAEAESEGDVFTLVEKHGARGYLATRFDGKTHYLTAPCGDRAIDFVQLEVEEIREVVDRPLFDEDRIPDDIEDFLDPVVTPKVDIVRWPLGEARYVLHSITDIADLVRKHAGATAASDRRYIRFLEEWNHSSAGAQARFCEHWALRLFRFTDRFGEQKVEATPLPARQITAPPIAAQEPHGVDLAHLLHAIDHDAGYPMAWYFHMLIKKKSLTRLPPAICDDHMGDYCYVPERDLAIVSRWIKQPYSF